MHQEFLRGFNERMNVCETRYARPLGTADESEILRFLAARPIHTVFMASLIRDNGVVSDLNRGSFFGCRTPDGALDGVALLGHATLIETENQECIRAFAHLAKNQPPAHLIRGEQHKIESFWQYFTEGQYKPRVVCGELLLELDALRTDTTAVDGLRRATVADLEAIVNVNAAMACNESGINPLDRDPDGFRARNARRIGKGRVWVWIEDQRLLYKTDVVAETSQAVYLEGVYVDPKHRNRGYGLRCLTQLAGSLLKQTETICLTVNEKNPGTQRFYKKAGYKLVCRYDSIYLDSTGLNQTNVS
jgi:hypothetical protein